MEKSRLVPIVSCGWPWIIWPLIVASVLALVYSAGMWWFLTGGLLLSLFMVYFHRDPERQPASGLKTNILAGADGLVRNVEVVREDRFFGSETVRISTFLSPFDVHVNRSPIGGQVLRLEYVAGKHLLTLDNASSERNEHSAIFIKGERVNCLVKQIVGPVVRRVVYWLTPGQILERGARIGMMRFGSRLDIYLPKDSVDVVVKKGDRVRAGVTVIAIVKGGVS